MELKESSRGERASGGSLSQQGREGEVKEEQRGKEGRGKKKILMQLCETKTFKLIAFTLTITLENRQYALSVIQTNTTQ